MIRIKEFSNQTYEEIKKEPHCELCFFSNEKDIVEIVWLHFSENIKEAIHALQECSKYDFTKKSIFELTDGKKSLIIFPLN